MFAKILKTGFKFKPRGKLWRNKKIYEFTNDKKLDIYVIRDKKSMKFKEEWSYIRILNRDEKYNFD